MFIISSRYVRRFFSFGMKQGQKCLSGTAA